MNIQLPIVKIGVMLLMSQSVACGLLSFPAAAPIELSISTSIPVIIDTASARLPLELVWEIGGGPHALDVPVGVAADAEGNIYVMDTNNFRVQKFDSKGNYLLMWGSEGSGDGQFSDILDAHEGHLAVDTQRNVYVIDLKNLRIQKFGSNGNYLTHWEQRVMAKASLHTHLILPSINRIIFISPMLEVTRFRSSMRQGDSCCAGARLDTTMGNSAMFILWR